MANVKPKSYKEVMQDMVDAFANSSPLDQNAVASAAQVAINNFGQAQQIYFSNVTFTTINGFWGNQEPYELWHTGNQDVNHTHRFAHTMLKLKLIGKEEAKKVAEDYGITSGITDRFNKIRKRALKLERRNENLQYNSRGLPRHARGYLLQSGRKVLAPWYAGTGKTGLHLPRIKSSKRTHCNKRFGKK